MDQKKPMISVVMITYGHEKYIHQAIEGVFMQKTNFDIEFIIANDFSPDASDEIIRELIKKAPANITVKYTRHEKNKGMMPNFIWALEQASGKYTAVCEGDDYWTSEDKLQKQVDFLESNDDFSLCFHRVYYLKDEKLILTNHIEEDKEYTFSDITKHNFINTLSVVFRNGIVKIPDWFHYIEIGDYPLWILLAEKGKLKYISEIMGVYRFGVGFHTTLSGIKQMENMNFCLTFLFKTHKHNKIISGQIKNYMNINDSHIFARKMYDNIHNQPSEIYSNLSFASIIKLFVYKAISKISNKKTH